MKTEVFRDDLTEAARLIREGELVAVPTETVYGLAGNGLDEQAVHAIYEVKGRPAVKALSLMVPDASSIDLYCEEIPEAARILAEKFWPGPLTLVMKSKPSVPSLVRAGGETVGLRCPDHPMTLELLRISKLPFAAPSANPSGRPSPKTAEEVISYFDGKIAGVVDGGACGIGKESTILDMSEPPYRILRQGALSEAEILAALADSLTIIGITGGTGCGKTTALQELEKRGALILDCDAVYHRLLETDKALISELDKAFPGTVSNGKLERKKLGTVVFQDPEALQRLNTLAHRHITLAIEKELRSWAAQGGQIAALDAIELIGSGLGKRCSATVAILADEEVRAERIMARDGISRDYALMRIRAQKPNRYFEENCTYSVYNNGDKESFVYQFDQILEDILRHG